MLRDIGAVVTGWKGDKVTVKLQSDAKLSWLNIVLWFKYERHLGHENVRWCADCADHFLAHTTIFPGHCHCSCRKGSIRPSIFDLCNKGNRSCVHICLVRVHILHQIACNSSSPHLFPAQISLIDSHLFPQLTEVVCCIKMWQLDQGGKEGTQFLSLV